MKDDIIKLRNEGKTYNEIKNILNCSKSVISYHCNRNKDKINFYLNDIDIDIQNKILENRKNGMKLDRIYHILNKEITKENIKNLCRKNGLSHLNYLNKEDIKKIRDKFKEIGRYKETGRILGYDYNTVRKYTKDLYRYRVSKKVSKSDAVISWRKRTKKKLVDYKGGKCIKCGYNKYPEILEFHHKNEHDKDFTISGKSWSFERLKKEVDKCILVCSNCHKEIHIEKYK